MTTQEVIDTLTPHIPELKAEGVTGVLIFGSVARGDQGPESDVDLLAEFDQSARLTLFDIGGIQYDLETWLGVKVDLSSPPWLKERIRDRVLGEAVRVF